VTGLTGPRTLVVMGVSGTGKSTVARLIAEQAGWALIEADDVHPPANIDKMSAGVALTDEDRWPWLDALGARISATPGSVVVACSALRRVYRDRLRVPGRRTYVLHLAGPAPVIAERLRGRSGHFMPPALLDSQLRALEPLEPDEAGLTLGIDTSPHEIVRIVLSAIDDEQEQG